MRRNSVKATRDARRTMFTEELHSKLTFCFHMKPLAPVYNRGNHTSGSLPRQYCFLRNGTAEFFKFMVRLVFTPLLAWLQHTQPHAASCQGAEREEGLVEENPGVGVLENGTPGRILVGKRSRALSERRGVCVSGLGEIAGPASIGSTTRTPVPRGYVLLTIWQKRPYGVVTLNGSLSLLQADSCLILRDLQSATVPCSLWIRAACINQRDKKECNSWSLLWVVQQAYLPHELFFTYGSQLWRSDDMREWLALKEARMAPDITRSIRTPGGLFYMLRSLEARDPRHSEEMSLDREILPPPRARCSRQDLWTSWARSGHHSLFAGRHVDEGSPSERGQLGASPC